MAINTGPLDEESALLGGSRRRGIKRTRAEKGVTCNRYIMLVFLAALVGLSVFFEQQINNLQGQLSESKLQIQNISQVLALHDQVIERFNSSVTNADVISELTSLGDSLNQTAVRLRQDLESVQKNVQQQLDKTVQQLSDTVTQAEQEIEDEVEKVKADVEHYVITTQDQFSMENSFMVYQLAGTFTLLSCLISMWHMTAHLRKMAQPDVQRKILAILWMSPIYAITSWFSLVFHSAEGYLAIIKDGYEAYIIYQFLSFCIAVIGRGDREVVVDVLTKHADHLTPPFRLFGCFEMCGCCIPDPYVNSRALADAILLQCQGFAMQFVLFRPLTTTANVVLKNMNYYGLGDGPTDYRSPQFYITIIQNISIFTAFTGLLKFYHAVDKELAWCRPLAKFLCIKGVVFMTFWQGLAISILAHMTDVGGEDQAEWAMSAQNFLICLEMLLFSIAHFYCFPTEEWQEGYRIKAERAAFGDTIALGDFFQDVKLILTNNNNNNNKKHKHHRRKRTSLGEHAASSKGKGDVENAMDRGEENLATDVLAVDLSLDPEPVNSSLDVGSSDEGGDDDDDDDESTESTEEEDLNDEQQFVKNALEKSLGNLGDDPDIQEATKRLLESKVLSPDFFSSADIPVDEPGDHGDDEFVSAGSEEEDDESSYEDSEDDIDEDEDEANDLAPLEATSALDTAAGEESSELLDTESSSALEEAENESSLERAYEQKGLEFLKPSRPSVGDKMRPSIFTTIAEEQEKIAMADTTLEEVAELGCDEKRAPTAMPSDGKSSSTD
mmetsp:Transcript_18717/g.40287  ORF Transcript_18717/g.40287 Transcript_18717/m.40287 type:complete len:782 (+) Transcript_18717:270-2615(+)